MRLVQVAGMLALLIRRANPCSVSSEKLRFPRKVNTCVAVLSAAEGKSWRNGGLMEHSPRGQIIPHKLRVKQPRDSQKYSVEESKNNTAFC